MASSHGLARLTGHVAKAVTIIAVSAALLAQTPQPGARPDPKAITDTDKRPYDKHDFSGLWARNPQTYGLQECAECRDTPNAPGYGFFGNPPPRTPEQCSVRTPGDAYSFRIGRSTIDLRPNCSHQSELITLSIASVSGWLKTRPLGIPFSN